MSTPLCYWSICFVPLRAQDPKFFGFSEFLAALALMVLAWTIADVRYRFRVKTAPLPLQGGTYTLVGIVGVLTLLTDWWRAEQWIVPEGRLLTPASWQALLGAIFLANFMVWAWFAFVRPPVFGRWNARRFAHQLYLVIVKGSPNELPEIADELGRSAKQLIRHTWSLPELEAQERLRLRSHVPASTRRSSIRQCAHDVLLLLADRKFCRNVVQSAPSTALALFEAINAQNKYDVALGTFARNVTSEAIANKDSFAYHEVAGYQTGFIGYYKPLTSALYGNYLAVSKLEQVFDVDQEETRRWQADQWAAFCRLVLVTFRSYVHTGAQTEHSFVLNRVAGVISRAPAALYKLNGAPTDGWAGDELGKLSTAIYFVVDVIKILDASEFRPNVPLRRKKADPRSDVYQLIAKVIVDLILLASTVKQPRDLSWAVQHNAVWSELFTLQPNGPAGKIILYKVRRRLYDEIARITTFPNFKSSKLLAMLLNVMGLHNHKSISDRTARPLHVAVLSWTQQNYVRLAEQSPRVASDCLPEGVTYEPDGPCLAMTGVPVLDRVPFRAVLDLQPYEKHSESDQ
ncbi:hypothetical protein [Paraburkholderia sp. RL17-381-BIF-C]|uniref:hypothetical protein n=1 Tax=Paraburkholderia sp. RL17-381-BIF-C TaxID=3031635 RepID=UPI0038BA23FB